MWEARGQALPPAESSTRRRDVEVPACRPAVVSPLWLDSTDLDRLRREMKALPSVGIAEIDAGHRQLVLRYDRLLKGFGRHRDVGAFALGFHALVQRVRQQFDREERLMVELGYDGYELHRQVHRKVMSDAQRYLVALIGRHERDQCLTVATWFSHWLLNHVTTHDRKIGDSLSRDIWQR